MKTRKITTRRSIASRVLVCLLAFLVARPQMVVATAAPAPAAADAANEADQQSGGVPPNAQLCTFKNPCESWPTPPLLNLDSGSYVPTADQKVSLRALEAQAIANVIKGHDLTDADTDAVKTWGRYDALAELYTLIVSAINASDRTPDQQNVADWVAAAGQQLSIGAAQAAGREYVKWAALDPLKYEALLKSDTSEKTLKDFLQQTPLNYDNPDITKAKAGWCIYRSPDPYDTDYKGWDTSPQCHDIPCPSLLGCNPPTPSYDDFVKWGQATSAATILNSAEFQRTGHQLGQAIGIAVAVAAAVPAAIVAPALLVGVPTAAQIAAFAAEGVDVVITSLTPFTAAVSTVAAAAAIVAIVIFAVVTAVIEGMHVIQASELPGQLAELITDSYTTTVDPSTLLTTSDGGTSLYTVFVAAILPEPLPTVCDNAGGLPPGVTFTGDMWEAPQFPPCMNAPAIPAPSALDPQFLVTRDGDTRETASSTISLQDSSGVATTVRLSKTWFVAQANGVTTQELRLDYVDWDGKNQIAWLLGNSSDGYGFISFSPPDSDSSQTLDPDTCVDEGLCSSGLSLKYVGSDGRHYSARVRGYSATVGTPTFSGPKGNTTGIEGSPMTFDANDFTLSDAVGTVIHSWRFQREGCAFGIGPCVALDPDTGQIGPVYGGATGGDTVQHTFGLAGTYVVELTVTDTRLVKASTTFSVTVENVAPKVAVWSTCMSGGATEPCYVQTINQGGTATVFGGFSDPGLKSNLTVTVDWGDGTRVSQCVSPTHTCVNFPDATLQLSGDPGRYEYNATHLFPSAGTYYGTIWVTDPIGGSASETFVVKVVRLSQKIDFRAPQSLIYGTAPLRLTANGGMSGQPVTLAVSGDSAVCALSDISSNGASTSATVTLLTTGACILTAAQAGNDQYDAARSASRSFDVTPASLMVTASSATMTFGAPVPAITPGYGAFANGDTPSSIFTAPTCAADLANGANVGSHPTQCSGGLDVRYVFRYTDGTLTIEKASTSLGLTSAAGGAVKGQPLTFTAALAVTAPGSGHPGGTVSFTDGSSTIAECATQPVDPSTGVASCTTTALAVGSHRISASYTGDGNFKPSGSSAPVVKTVAKAGTATSVTAPTTPPVKGQSVTLTATVAVNAPGSGTPSGTVTFFDGTTRLGSGSLTIVSNQVKATFATSGLAIGKHTITATYAGDGDFTTSTSAAATVYVNTDLSGAPRQPSGAYDLRNMNLKGAYLVGMSLAGARMDTVNLQDAVMIGADLSGATGVLVNLGGANLTNAVMVSATFKDSTFKAATLTGANLTGTSFNGGTFKDAIGLPAANLAGVTWLQTTCPNGTNSGGVGGTCVGRW